MHLWLDFSSNSLSNIFVQVSSSFSFVFQRVLNYTHNVSYPIEVSKAVSKGDIDSSTLPAENPSVTRL